jgi:moderate conductance mechanosensitive channel
MMPDQPEAWASAQRILLILGSAVAASLVVRGLRRFGEWVLTPPGGDKEAFTRWHPKIATVTTVVVSALVFAIYFAAVGFVLQEIGIALTAYLASASVIGLAVGFGSQGLVQDVVIGLTLIFSDVLEVGDVVDIAGQSGRVEMVGLRFTVLVNLLDQRVYIPNRNITQINRYRQGFIRAFVDVQVPDSCDEDRLVETVEGIARGFHGQHRAIVLAEPEPLGVRQAGPGLWRFLRMEFRLWPAQGGLVETAFVRRLLASLRQIDPEYADWMVTVTYRATGLVEELEGPAARTRLRRVRRPPPAP